MNLILYTQYARYTGREIAKQLGIAGRFIISPKFIKQASKIIRWGYYEPLPTSVPQINTAASIKKASGKFGALQTLRANGIPVPDHVLASKVDHTFWEKHEGLWLGRRFTHTGGKDVIFSDEIWDEDVVDYYTKYIKPHREWRVHVFNSKLLFAQRKVWCGEGEKTKAQSIVRNYDNGWRFYRLQDENNLPINVKNASIRAVDALGLTFGAVDVISHGRDENDKRGAFVLEVNTAPGLDEGYGMDMYVQKFKEWLG
jgi:hypothetical protein